MVVVAVAGIIAWLYTSVLAVENPALRNGAFGSLTRVLLTVGALAGIAFYRARALDREVATVGETGTSPAERRKL